MTCSDHDFEIVCEREGFETNGLGFPHAAYLKGRTAARHCHACDRLIVQKPDTRRGLPPAHFSVQLGALVHPYCPKCYLRLPLGLRGLPQQKVVPGDEG